MRPGGDEVAARLTQLKTELDPDGAFYRGPGRGGREPLIQRPSRVTTHVPSIGRKRPSTGVA
jgi:hypothetical protein